MAAWCLSREWALFIIERIRAGSCLSLLASDWSQLWLSWPLIGQHSSGYNKCRLHHLRILVSPVSARISASEDLSALSSLSEAGLSQLTAASSLLSSLHPSPVCLASLLSQPPAWQHTWRTSSRLSTPSGSPQERYYTLMVDVIWSHLSAFLPSIPLEPVADSTQLSQQLTPSESAPASSSQVTIRWLFLLTQASYSHYSHSTPVPFFLLPQSMELGQVVSPGRARPPKQIQSSSQV